MSEYIVYLTFADHSEHEVIVWADSEQEAINKAMPISLEAIKED
ncbi:hypothetical protein [Sporolactobacillus terrae]|uniref:Uncharacterized protein n=1 Tax=Sporolactobacillus terrae TaxID=269673 RepID=A0A5K7X056_9BACL|nr:hypothetical protein [Sporolactobacillus terrae]BBN97476.1 hypothetical protein St703_01810 [Sporolactobacillus terrae]